MLREREQHQPVRLVEQLITVEDEAIKRAQKILDPNTNYEFLEVLAMDIFVSNELFEEQAPDIDITPGEKGIQLLEEILKQKRLEEKLDRIKRFEGIKPKTFLRETKPEIKRTLSLIRLVINDFSDESSETTENGELEEKLELFAAVVGFAQAFTVQQLDLHAPKKKGEKDPKKEERHAKQDAILGYGMQLLGLTEQFGLRDNLLARRKTKKKPQKGHSSRR